jgi:hypothetical protein
MGGAWRFKKNKCIEINGKNTKVLMLDLVETVYGFKLSDADGEN